MLLFVFFIAVINLAVGYALGAGLRLPSISRWLPQRDERPVIADIDDAVPLSRVAPKSVPVIESAPAPAPTPAATPLREAAAKPKPSASDIMASLAAFREKLSHANFELDANQEDVAKFEASATQLQAASHEYLDEAVEVIKQLDELGAAGDATATATRDAVSSGATNVAAISSEIDGIIESGLSDGETRQKLLDRSQTLSEVALEVEMSAIQAASPEKPVAAAPIGKATGEVVRASNVAEIDRLFDDLEALLRDAEDDAVSHVAIVRLDAPPDAERSETVTAALEESIGAIAKEVLAEGQTFVPGAPAYLLLEGDTHDKALQRVERLRQQVEATVFSFDGDEIPVTVTCALADARKGDSREVVRAQLDEALGESGRLGGNKTFHHDGAFPTEAPRVKVAVEPRKLALA